MKDTKEVEDDHTDRLQSNADLMLSSSEHKAIFRGIVIQRFASLVGILALGVLYLFLSDKLIPSFIPRWLPLALYVVMIIPFGYALIAQRHLPHKLAQLLGLAYAAVATLALVSSLALLIFTLPHRGAKDAISLVRDAVILWVSNVIVFATWYWELDGGGPLQRHLTNHRAVDFMFPQQVDGNTDGWAPHFIDYIFLAFNTATAFSPTDTPPLSRSAKVLMMIESIISLVVIAGLAARAVNILGG